MAMAEITVHDQTLRYDADATAAIYARMRSGWADACGCAGCRNLLAQGDDVYPAAFKQLLEQLGIDVRKAAEVVADGPLENGLHHYGGWFFLVGEIVTPGESIDVVTDTPYFGYFFCRGGPCPEEFREGPRVALAFEAHLRWVLNESWDSDLRPAASRPPRS